MILVCPICKSILIQESQSYKCKNKHCFDLAKEGYINLLPVQNKKSKNPGDNKEMIKARREFLEDDYYLPLVESLVTILDKVEILNLLDSGCGEGYYSAKIAEVLEKEIEIIGFDISKEAIKKAAKKYKKHQYFVASAYDIPILANSVDAYLTIFAPILASEIAATLSKSGKAIIVTAGKNHMKEIAELIYDEYKTHEYSPESKMLEHFELCHIEECNFNINLQGNRAITNMLKMTPYYWSANDIQLENMKSLKSIDVTCEFDIYLFSHK